MKVSLKWDGGRRFVGRGASGPPVCIGFSPGATLPVWETSSPENEGEGDRSGGTEQPDSEHPGPWPTELLLIATGACTGYDVLSILDKKRIEFTGLELEVNGERSPDHPRFFTDVEITYRLHSQGGEAARAGLERAAELSMEKYCSVSQSLRADKSWRCEVVPG